MYSDYIKLKSLTKSQSYRIQYTSNTFVQGHILISFNAMTF
jgi:hypothetical protein